MIRRDVMVADRPVRWALIAGAVGLSLGIMIEAAQTRQVAEVQAKTVADVVAVEDTGR